MSDRKYADLHEHLQALERAGLLITVDRPINKDTEMHPLVRWQFRGGIAERDRKAFLFNHVVDCKKRKYDIPVVVGALAASREIYRIGMNCPLEKINEVWTRAIAQPIAPRIVQGRRVVSTSTEAGRAWIDFRSRSRRRAGTSRRSPRSRSTSPRIPRPACRTWASTAAR